MIKLKYKNKKYNIEIKNDDKNSLRNFDNLPYIMLNRKGINRSEVLRVYRYDYAKLKTLQEQFDYIMESVFESRVYHNGCCYESVHLRFEDKKTQYRIIL